MIGGRRPGARDVSSRDVPSRLERELGLADAVVVGLGAMVGAGVFAAFGPAARAAGSGLLLGLVVAAAVASCNATSSAQLAARYPESGGTYAYGRHRLGPFWGYLAGWAFVVGKTASCTAIALTFGAYTSVAHQRLLAVAAVAVLAALNLGGVGKTARTTRVLVAIVLASLVVVVSSLFGSDPQAARLDLAGTTPVGALRAAGFLFFAFAGYARITTLGEEVAEPERTIPRAVRIALAVTVVIYAAVAIALLLTLGPEGVARSAAPLRAAVDGSGLRPLAPLVALGAAVASLGVLLSLLAGLSRTIFAMAANGDLPRGLAAVHPRSRIPHRAEIAIALVVSAVVASIDTRAAIGFSSFCVLLYYAMANASAFTLRSGTRLRAVAAGGFVGCLLVASTLPASAVEGGAAALAVGALVYVLRRRRSYQS